MNGKGLKGHHSALTIALKLGLETVMTMCEWTRLVTLWKPIKIYTFYIGFYRRTFNLSINQSLLRQKAAHAETHNKVLRQEKAVQKQTQTTN